MLIEGAYQIMMDAPKPQTSESSASPRTKGKRSWYTDPLLVVIGLLIFLLDQLSKYLVRTNLQFGESWPSEGLIRITHATNTGSAFSLFQDQTTFLILASFVAIAFLFYFYKTQSRPKIILRLAIGLQLGGAFGNLIDRVRTGAVVDFFDVGWWPIFNVADSSVVVGMVLLVAVLLLGEREEEKPPGDEIVAEAQNEGSSAHG